MIGVDPPLDPAKTLAASEGKVGELFVGRTGGRDCWAAEVMVNAQPGATALGICPGGGIVRRRNERDPPFLCCALGVPRISRRGRGL